MHPKRIRYNHLKFLSAMLALGVGSTQAQTLHVGGDGVIGDTVLTTTGGTALVGIVGASWKVDGGTGAPVSSTLSSPAAAVPSAGNVTLTFTHRYSFESGWDGGAVFIMVNDNPVATYVNGVAFSSNGYVGNTIGDGSAAWAGGENVFYGASTGYSTSELITSVANLGPLNAGDTVSVRFKGEWDQGTTTGPPAWEIATMKLTDAAATDFVNINFATGDSGFTVENEGTVTGPWTYALKTADVSFEINGDTLAADRYAPSIAGSVIDFNNAVIGVKLLAGTLEGGEVFSLFNLTGGTTLTGTPASITLPAVGIWDTSNLTIDGTIRFVSPPPTLTWNLASGGTWDTETQNWTRDGGTTTTTYADDAAVVFDKPEGGIITGVVNWTPFSTTVNSAGNYSFFTGITPNGTTSILGGVLTKSGTGILQLGDSTLVASAANIYSNAFSAVQVNAGELRYASRTALGTATVTMEDATMLTKVAQEGNSAGLALPNNFVLNGRTTLRTVFNPLKDQWFSGVFSGTGGLWITGERRAISLTGNNTFSGGVIMENYEGTGSTALYNLDIGHVNALGTGTLTVNTALLAGLTQFRGLGTTTALTAGSGVTNDVIINTGATFYVGRGQNLRLGGAIAGGGALFKRNTTTVFLDGANTYTGGTKVEAGILTIGGSLADATMNITGGTVDGAGTLNFNIDGTTTDQIAMSGGTLNATGLTVAINPAGTGLTETEYVLVNATGGSGGTVTGTFAGLTGAPNYALNYDTPGLVKLVKTAIANPYANWSGGATADIDTNSDGVANGVAWALGAVDPNANALGLLPTLDNTSDPIYAIFKFNRSDAANDDPNTAITVQYGSDLTGWNTAVDDDDVDIIVTPGSPVDAVEVKLKRSTLGTSATIFARLKVIVTTP